MGADLLGIGKSALNASKKSLATSSHNIANANNENFSRQRVNLRTNTPIGMGNYAMGTGVNVRSIKRVHDTLVEKRLNDSITAHEFDKERNSQLSRVEEIFNEVNSDGMNKLLNRFFNSFRELANQPDNETVRSIVRENARVVVNDFKRQSNEVTLVRENIERKMTSAVKEVNELSYRIGKLNKQIAAIEVTAKETGDLRDQRDAAVRQMSEYFNLKTYVDNQGQYVVNVEGVGTLVTGTAVQELKVGSVKHPETGRGQAEIYFDARPTAPITKKFESGLIGALRDTRNNELEELENQVNELAYSLAKATNAIHRQGFKHGEIPTDAQGNLLVDPRMGKITGIDFFKEPVSKVRAAEYLEISDDVKSDLRNITTGLAPNQPGDNRIAIAISKLQHEKILTEGTTTLEEHHLQMVGNIGLKTGKSAIDMEQSSGILAQAKSVKERISGVSIDEETANMMKYQQSYEASARVIKVANDTFQSVLGLLG